MAARVSLAPHCEAMSFLDGAMTKLVIGLAVVVVVVLTAVILVARNMRPDDPEDFAGRSGNRSRNGSDDHTGDHPVAGHRPPPGHHGGSHGHVASRDRLGASVPGDRGTDRRAGDAGNRRRAEAPASASARSRQGRGNRSGDSADWPSTEWEKLSDVDYWAELAADKPLTTTAQPATPASHGQDSHDRDLHAAPVPVPAVPVPAVPVPAVPVPAVPVPAVPVPAVPVPERPFPQCPLQPQCPFPQSTRVPQLGGSSGTFRAASTMTR